MLTLLALFSVTAIAAAGNGRGFGDDIDWKLLADTDIAASDLTMVVIHKSWCGACKSLGPQVAADPKIKELSAKFTMVNVIDDEEPEGDARFAGDGGYIPRVFFYSKGKLLDSVTSGNDQYKYYFSSAEAVASAMEKAAAQ